MIVVKKSLYTIGEICEIIKAGSVIAAPTETAYGLLADATNPKAVARVVKIKGREPGKPIALMAADVTMVKKYFRLTKRELILAKKFWPGPLTLLLKPKFLFLRPIVGPGGLAGVRIPGNRWLCRLLSQVGVPVTATSANQAGQPTLYSSKQVCDALEKRGLRYVVDAGRIPIRKTSTVAVIVNGTIRVQRPGAITEKRLQYSLR